MIEDGRSTAPAGESGRGPTVAAVGKGAAWIAVGQALGQVFWAGSLVALGALLPPDAFGTVSLVMAVVGMATLLMESGTYGSIIASKNPSPRRLIRALLLNVLLGTLGSLAVSLLAGTIVDRFAEGGDAEVVVALTLVILLSALGVVPVAMLLKAMRFRRYAGISVVASALASTVAVVAAVAGAGVWSLVVRQVVSQAVITALAWWSVRDTWTLRSSAVATTDEASSGSRGRWFLLLAAADFVAYNADFVVVGWRTDAASLGLYSLAFTLAFAPLKQFAWQIGAVLFSAAAATDDPARVRTQLLRTLRITSVLLLPLLPPAVVLAPLVLPALFGSEWTGMVTPFRILIVVGVGHAVLNGVGEFLSGTGNADFRARTAVGWAVAMVGALLVLVAVDGLRGAAVAHAVLFLALAAVYGRWGLRRLGISGAEAAVALRGPAGAVAVQAVVTVASGAALNQLGVGPWPGALAGVGAGLVAGWSVVERYDRELWAETREVLSAVIRRRQPA